MFQNDYWYLSLSSMSMIKHMIPVGSRVTCRPAPTDTDQDYLVLLKPNVILWEFAESIENSFEINNDELYDSSEEDTFFSARLGDMNLIVTANIDFFLKFLVATNAALNLNLLDKQDRVMLFKSILYENPHGLTEEQIADLGY